MRVGIESRTWNVEVHDVEGAELTDFVIPNLPCSFRVGSLGGLGDAIMIPGEESPILGTQAMGELGVIIDIGKGTFRLG